MRIILKIAKAELLTLFYSPVAWVIAVAFFVICGVQFADPLVEMAARQQFSVENMKAWTGFSFSLSRVLFDESYKFLLNNLFLFIPLLTMGVISREITGGTIQLLGSSPVRTRDIVLGKYLGLAIYNAILMVPVILLLFTGYFSIVSAEYKVFLSALLGIYLLSCTYTAIGLFISSLTNYQVVAALCTFLVFFVLSYISFFWQQYDFFRDLTWFLNLSGRVESFLYGLITSKDLAYFLLINVLFVGFTLIRLYNRQESRKWYVFAGRYLLLLVVVLMAGYFSSRPATTVYRDVTRGKVNTIHPLVQEVVKELGPDPLTITLYVNLMDPNAFQGFPSERNKFVWDLWGKYIRFHPDIRFNYVYYYDLPDSDTMFRKTYPNKTLDEVAKRFMRINQMPEGLFKTPAEIRKIINLAPEDKRMVMELAYKGKKTFLRTHEDAIFWPDQNEVAGAIRRVTRDSMPSVLFTTGHYERSPFKTGEREYAPHTLMKLSRGAMLNLGLDVDTLNLAYQDIPSSCLLVVADPKSALAEAEQEKIRQHLLNGGNAIFYGEPGKQAMLNPMLKDAGIVLDEGIIVRPDKNEMPQNVYALFTDTALYMADEVPLWKTRKSKEDTLAGRFAGMAAISYEEANGFRIEPVFRCPDMDNVWIERGQFVPDSAAPTFSAAQGDVQQKKYIVAVKLSRQTGKREQRIVVTGDADFMSALRGSGGAMGNGLYSWAVYNEYPVYTNYPDPTDIRLTVSRPAAKSMRIVFVYIIPALVLAAGAILLIRRKRK